MKIHSYNTHRCTHRETHAKTECNSYFPEAWTLKKEANNSNNKIHKPVSVTENRNNPVELKSRKRALMLTTKSTYLRVFESRFSVNYKDDYRHSGEETGHALPQFGHPANEIISLY